MDREIRELGARLKGSRHVVIVTRAELLVSRLAVCLVQVSGLAQRDRFMLQRHRCVSTNACMGPMVEAGLNGFPLWFRWAAPSKASELGKAAPWAAAEGIVNSWNPPRVDRCFNFGGLGWSTSSQPETKSLLAQSA